MNFGRSAARRRNGGALVWVVVLALAGPATFAQTPAASPAVRSPRAAKPAATPAAAPAIAVEPERLPATGRQEAIVRVTRFGRYSIGVKSPQGAALQLIDRMAGPGTVEGKAGERDGRIDAFLDRGEYKVIVLSHPRGSGVARLEVHPFKETHPKPPLLVELKPVESTLADLTQRSYWLEIKERRTVALEAAGRDLADLRLWTGGDWLVDAEPQCQVVSATEGKPLKVCRLARNLSPGFYLLTAYGGVPQAWAEESGDHPFYLRYGIPRLAEVGRSRYQVSPFGTDRWRLPGQANYIRFELPESAPFDTTVALFGVDAPFDAEGERRSLTKQALLPVVEYELEQTANDRVLTVTGAAGQAYVLQHFDFGTKTWCGRAWRLPSDGAYWLSTVHSGDPDDSIDATAMVVRFRGCRFTDGHDGHMTPFLDSVIRIGEEGAWVRRANLLEPLSVFLQIPRAGKYQVLARGVEAKFRFQPFILFTPEGYEAPEWQGAGSVWDLEPGYWVLSARPEKKGIVDIAVAPIGRAKGGDLFESLAGVRGAQAVGQPAAQWPNVDLATGDCHWMVLNDQPEVNAGLVLRKLPLDLAEPLPVFQKPGESISMAVTVSEPGIITAASEEDVPVELSLDGHTWLRALEVSGGKITVATRHAADHTVNFTLGFAPTRMLAATELPPLPDTADTKPPRFPVLSENEPHFLDLGRQESTSFLLRADRPALYRLQSSGLLATEGNVRTRTIISLDRQNQNGVGRNFFVEQYLREGDYQLTVSTLGETRGHLGVTLERSHLIDGGELTADLRAAASLSAGQAVVYRFKVAEKGEYRIRSLGVGRTFRARLEDGDGWPIERPNVAADITREFEPGTYRFVSMPEPVASRRVTLLERIVKPLRTEGHGPHELPLDKTVEHLWLESEPGTTRRPDLWDFTLPADAVLSVELTDGMQAAVLRNEQPVAEVPVQRGWRGKLDAGSYRLRVVSSRTNNRQPYRVAVRPEPLVAGLTREVTPPAEIPVAVGQAGLIELRSFGTADVRARLLDAAGKQVASSDDGRDDWNFHLQQRLDPGSYRLLVEQVGSGRSVPVQPAANRFSEDEAAQPHREEGEYGEYEEGEYGEGELDCGTSRCGEPAHGEDGSTTGREGETPRAAEQAGLSGSVTVSMRAPQTVRESAQAVPATVPLELGDSVRVVPLEVPEDSELLLVAAQAAEGIGCAVEMSTGGGWTMIASARDRRVSLEIPLEGLGRRRAGARFQVRLWSLDGRKTATLLKAAVATPPRVDEAALERGVLLAPVPAIEPPLGMIAVNVERPGVFRLSGEAAEIRSSSVVGSACRAGEGGRAFASGTVLYLVGDLAQAGVGQRVSGARMALGAGENASIQFSVGDEPLACDLEQNGPGPVLVVAESMSGQPGVQVLNADADFTARDRGRGMAVGERSALAVSLAPQSPLAVVWSAAPHDDAIEVRVRQSAFAPPQPQSAAWGTTEGRLSGTEARAFDLPAGRKRLRLALGAGTAAVLSDGDAVRSTHWAGGEAFDESVLTRAGRLTILHASTGEGRFLFELLPEAENAPDAVLREGVPFETALGRAGTLRLRVEADGGERGAEPRRLHVRGSGTAVVFVRDDGVVQRGSDLSLAAAGRGAVAGTLLVRHRAGLLLAWLDRKDAAAADLWGKLEPPATAARFTVPAVVPLGGSRQLVQLHLGGPSMLHVRTAAPMVSLLRRGEEEPAVELHSGAVNLDSYVQGGTVLLGLRALAGAALGGTAEITASPVTPIEEGLGAEVLLSAGMTRLFSFEVPRRAAVGIGVRADPDVVEATLLDATGKRLGAGVVQMPVLEPGAYLLAVRVPAESGPVRVRPALAGVRPPGTGPPAEVVRQYLQSAQ